MTEERVFVGMPRTCYPLDSLPDQDVMSYIKTVLTANALDTTLSRYVTSHANDIDGEEILNMLQTSPRLVAYVIVDYSVEELDVFISNDIDGEGYIEDGLILSVEIGNVRQFPHGEEILSFLSNRERDKEIIDRYIEESGFSDETSHHLITADLRSVNLFLLNDQESEQIRQLWAKLVEMKHL